MDAAALAEVETLCRQAVADSLPVFAQEVPLQQARGIHGLRAVFGEVRTQWCVLARSAGMSGSRARLPVLCCNNIKPHKTQQYLHRCTPTPCA